jgi:hypothetical protein
MVFDLSLMSALQPVLYALSDRTNRLSRVFEHVISQAAQHSVDQCTPPDLPACCQYSIDALLQLHCSVRPCGEARYGSHLPPPSTPGLRLARLFKDHVHGRAQRRRLLGVFVFVRAVLFL